jgi:hypothetical protein
MIKLIVGDCKKIASYSPAHRKGSRKRGGGNQKTLRTGNTQKYSASSEPWTPPWFVVLFHRHGVMRSELA